MVESYRATVNGGIPLGRPSNIAETARLIRETLGQRRVAYMRHVQNPNITATFRPDGTVTANNMVGDPVDLPDWAVKAQRHLS